MPYSFITNHFRSEHDDVTESLNQSMEVDVSSKIIPASGIPLDMRDGKVSISAPEHHCLVCGTSGRGKTRRVLYPTAILSARSGHSVIAVDPKGELYRHTANEIRRCGHNEIGRAHV